MRTPCIVWWPGQVRAGEVCDVPAATIDWLPTIAAITATRPPADRTNIASLMLQGVHPRVDPERPIVFYHYAARNLQSIRMGRWKLHLPHTYTYASQIGNDGRRGSYANRKIELSLFDLETDPAETRNVAADHPRIVDRMLKIANRYRRDLGDGLTNTPPGPNVRPIGVRP